MIERIALVAEHLEVGKREVETGRVRISKRVVETEERIEVALRRETVEIERISVNRFVDHADAPRQEGDVTIVPVYEEVMVKQLVLKEELHISRRSTTEVQPSGLYPLRREEIEITRTPFAGDANLDGESG